MLSHRTVWLAIDQLAARNGMSTSGLAKRAGLDPTTFNKSKRRTRDGRERWPSTESLSKILKATGETLDTLTSLIETQSADDRLPAQRTVPLIGMAQAGAGGFFDIGGNPTAMIGMRLPFPTTRTMTFMPLRSAATRWNLSIAGEMSSLSREPKTSGAATESSFRLSAVK